MSGWLALPQIQRLLGQPSPTSKWYNSQQRYQFLLRNLYCLTIRLTRHQFLLRNLHILHWLLIHPSQHQFRRHDLPPKLILQHLVPIPTSIPSPIPSVSLDTSLGSVLKKGQYWRQNDLSMIMDNVVLDTRRSCVGFDFDLNNDSDHDVILTIVLSQFSVTDNTGRAWTPRALSHYVYCGDPGPWNSSQISTSVAPKQSYSGGRPYYMDSLIRWPAN